jgi:hypothetical protein
LRDEDAHGHVFLRAGGADRRADARPVKMTFGGDLHAGVNMNSSNRRFEKAAEQNGYGILLKTLQRRLPRTI